MMNHLPFSLKEVDLSQISHFSHQIRAARRMKIALVVQGGGQRGIFTAGVFDAFLEAGFDPFELYIGTSAGALISHRLLADSPVSVTNSLWITPRETNFSAFTITSVNSSR